MWFLILHLYTFQSTLLQEERRFHSVTQCSFQDLSIHAPTRGATHTYIYKEFYIDLSIHAPTRGATTTVVQIKMM